MNPNREFSLNTTAKSFVPQSAHEQQGRSSNPQQYPPFRSPASNGGGLNPSSQEFVPSQGKPQSFNPKPSLNTKSAPFNPSSRPYKSQLNTKSQAFVPKGSSPTPFNSKSQYDSNANRKSHSFNPYSSSSKSGQEFYPNSSSFVSQEQMKNMNKQGKLVNSKPYYPIKHDQPSLFSKVSRDFRGHKDTLQSLFVDDDLRYFLLEKTLFRYQLMHPHFVSFTFPFEVKPQSNPAYHSIFPLFQRYEPSQVFENQQIGVFKAVQSSTNSMVTLVRIQNSNSQSSNLVRGFRMVTHPNIVKLKNVFYSPDFITRNDEKKNELILVYDYTDFAETLYQLFIFDRRLNSPKENDMWSFICQIFSALKYLHSKGLYYGCMHLRKVLLSPQMKRIHLNAIGQYKLFNDTSSTTMDELQTKDIRDTARILLQLALCEKEEILEKDFDNKIDQLSGKFTKGFISFLKTLHSDKWTAKDVIKQHLGLHMMQEANTLHSHNDTMERELTKEIENGRLFRLLVKLNHVVQRIAYDPHPGRWEKQGDYYILKLFYNMLFRPQKKINGIIDWVHIVENLNKLDVGASESVLLASEDNQTILTLSYREIRECFQSAWRELVTI